MIILFICNIIYKTFVIVEWYGINKKHYVRGRKSGVTCGMRSSRHGTSALHFSLSQNYKDILHPPRQPSHQTDSLYCTCISLNLLKYKNLIWTKTVMFKVTTRDLVYKNESKRCHLSCITRHKQDHVGSSLKKTSSFPKQNQKRSTLSCCCNTLNNSTAFLLTQFLIRNFDKKVKQ